MLKYIFIIFVLILLVGCNNNSDKNIKTEKIIKNLGINKNKDIKIEKVTKELDEDYRGDNIYNWFSKASKLYDEGNYKEVNGILKKLEDNNLGIKEVEIFFRDSDIGKMYKIGNIRKFDNSYRGENIEKWLKEISKLYDEGNYKEVNEILKKLEDNNPGIEVIEDFLNNSDMGKAYKKRELLNLVFTEGDLEKIFKNITELYEENKYTELKKVIDNLVKDYRDNGGVKDFLEKSDIGKKYINNEL